MTRPSSNAVSAAEDPLRRWLGTVQARSAGLVASEAKVVALVLKDPALLRRMDAHWRLARHYGIANMLIFHKLTDLDNVGDQGSAMRSLANSLLANAETRIVYRQESDQLGATASALGLTGTEQKLLPDWVSGRGCGGSRTGPSFANTTPSR